MEEMKQEELCDLCSPPSIVRLVVSRVTVALRDTWMEEIHKEFWCKSLLERNNWEK
jgi:hypothetical protein